MKTSPDTIAYLAKFAAFATTAADWDDIAQFAHDMAEILEVQDGVADDFDDLLAGMEA